MKKLTLTCAIFGAFSALAFAGPLPMTSKEITPVPVPPASCFDGWYFGIHGGGLLQQDNNNETFASAFVGNLTGRDFLDQESSHRNDDFNGAFGMHAGRNWQHGGWVFGLEIDLTATGWDDRRSVFALVDPLGPHDLGVSVVSETALPYYGTFRPRIGHTLGDRMMVFVTGGGAVGWTKVSEVTGLSGTRGLSQPVVNPPNFNEILGPQLTEQDKGIEFGWTAGGGFEFCLTEHWILNFTYLYVDLGDKSVSSFDSRTGDGPNTAQTFTSFGSARNDFKYHVFQGGLTFHF
jgi:opacity protein-like surface antigen